jgi:hypothetical protein
MLSEKEIDDLPQDSELAIFELCRLFLATYDNTSEEEDALYYEDYLQLYALLSVYVEKHPHLIMEEATLVGSETSDPGKIHDTIAMLHEEVGSRQAQLKLSGFKEKYKNQLGRQFCYEFSQGDLDKIQSILNELRELLSHSESLDEEHKSRLLSRLENLQSEMHKKVSDLDRFWGLVGDAGVVIGKLGKDAKPMVDRIKEITEIVWRTQSRAEELPSGTPLNLLPSLDDNDA